MNVNVCVPLLSTRRTVRETSAVLPPPSGSTIKYGSDSVVAKHQGTDEKTERHKIKKKGDIPWQSMTCYSSETRERRHQSLSSNNSELSVDRTYIYCFYCENVLCTQQPTTNNQHQHTRATDIEGYISTFIHLITLEAQNTLTSLKTERCAIHFKNLYC